MLRQLIVLREEYIRLQQQLADAEEELETIHSGHLQEITNYQEHIKGLIAERDKLQEQYLQAEQLYQELDRKFQNGVEEEAFKMLTAATRTAELPPVSDAPTVQEDIRKTVELHIRQVEDQHIAQALYLARQAQRKAALLEEELARERQQNAQEREKLYTMQTTLREQAAQRKRTIDAHFRAKFAAKTILFTALLLLPLVLFQILLTAELHVYVILALIESFFLCLICGSIIVSVRSSLRKIITSVPHKHTAKD